MVVEDEALPVGEEDVADVVVVLEDGALEGEEEAEVAVFHQEGAEAEGLEVEGALEVVNRYNLTCKFQLFSRSSLIEPHYLLQSQCCRVR